MRFEGAEVVVKLTLIVPVVVVGLALCACDWSSSGSPETAAPSENVSVNDRSQNGKVKGSTSSDSAPLSADQADQRAQDRCSELGMIAVATPTMRKETDPNFMVWKMPEIRRYIQCVGERQAGTRCVVSEFDQVAFQRAQVNGEAEVLKCSVGNGGLLWLRIEAFPGS